MEGKLGDINIGEECKRRRGKVKGVYKNKVKGKGMKILQGWEGKEG